VTKSSIAPLCIVAACLALSAGACRMALRQLPQLEPVAARRTVDPATGWDGVRDYRRFCVGVCQWCGKPEKTEWCHQFPQGLSTGRLEYLRYVESNGVELCREAHSILNHGKDFSHRYNPDLIRMVREHRWVQYKEGSAGK